jgi:ribosomal protein S18 acetylase RimI-like enzyme
MVFTNEKYRGNKICQKNIDKIIKLTKHMFTTYELEVDPNNIAAIKCYENIGFKFIKTIIYNKINSYNLMRYILI